MINSSNFTLVKNATVALGLVDEGGIVPKQICGTGFIVTKNQYLMTASHVVDACMKWNKMYEKKNIKTEIVAFNTLGTESEIKFHVLPVDPFSKEFFVKTVLKDPGEGFAGPRDFDIAIGKFLYKTDDFPFLEIKKPGESILYNEIAICGYPNGDQSLDLKRKFSGIRFSPIIQFGRIVGLLPSDNSKRPYGIQTDIVGTGGSSGSPIVSLEDGKVIGIAQQVILAEVNTNKKSIYGNAKIGLVNGVTNHIFYELYKQVPSYFENGKDISMKIPTTHFGKPTIKYKK